MSPVHSDFFDLASSSAGELQAGLVVSNDGSEGVIDDLVSVLQRRGTS